MDSSIRRTLWGAFAALALLALVGLMLTLTVLQMGKRQEYDIIHGSELLNDDVDTMDEDAGKILSAARGYHLSFAGNVTYPSAEHIRRAVAAVGEDRLLTETDSPFLPPQALRGRDNAPANVFAVADTLATVRGWTVERAVAATAANAGAAFPFPR